MDNFSPVGLMTSLISLGQVKPNFVRVVGTHGLHYIESSFAESLENENLQNIFLFILEFDINAELSG